MWQYGTSTRIPLHRQGLSTHAIFVWVDTAAYNALDHDRALFLHRNELAYYQRLPAPKRQQSYLLGRYAAKRALTTFLETADPTLIEVASGIFTQPIVKFPTPDPVAVSISHAGDFACALAAQKSSLALDIEPESRQHGGHAKSDSTAGIASSASACRTRRDPMRHHLDSKKALSKS